MSREGGEHRWRWSGRGLWAYSAEVPLDTWDTFIRSRTEAALASTLTVTHVPGAPSKRDDLRFLNEKLNGDANVEGSLREGRFALSEREVLYSRTACRCSE
eukprot:TRINITY_DN17399_c1_g1_i1.p1 TRINITY_DN17399_c1_g1~~TRINITY_DN17399_c1_g1_i1.p1  ORF type:complete len:101 (+),score=4.28 TRINITY_DN17399_c1_g1_i1:56-358(+)